MGSLGAPFHPTLPVWCLPAPLGRVTDCSLGAAPWHVPSFPLLFELSWWSWVWSPPACGTQTSPGRSNMDSLIPCCRGRKFWITVPRCLPQRLAEADLRGSVLPANLLRLVANSWKTLSKKHSSFAPMSLSDWNNERKVCLFERFNTPQRRSHLCR
jgi:hypothetical protein